MGKLAIADQSLVAAEMRKTPHFGRVNPLALIGSLPLKARHNVYEIALSAVVRQSPFQTRRKFDPEQSEADASLVESIRVLGQREPVGLNEFEDGKYEIVYGHRRIGALRCIGAATVLAIVVKGDMAELATWSAIENSGEPLSLVEKAELAAMFETQFRLTNAEICARLGCSETQLKYMRGVLRADDSVRFALAAETIGVKVGVALSRAPKEHQARLVEIAAAGKLRREDAEALVSHMEAAQIGPDEAAEALGFLAPTQNVNDNDGGSEVATDGAPAEAVEPIGANSGHGKKGSNGSRAPQRTRSGVAVDVLTKTLQNEFTTVDRAAVRAIVAKGLERGMNPRTLRVACALTGSQTPAKALDNAEALSGDVTARMAADIAETMGRLRDLVKRKQGNGMLNAMLQTLYKELAALIAESKGKS